MITFIHIPKTAGSTLRYILYRMYKPNQVFPVYSESATSAEIKISQLKVEQPETISLILGHIPYGVFGKTDFANTFITVLRDPIDRIISHYYFVKRSPDHHLYSEIASQNLTLDEYVLSGISTELDNGQTRMLCDASSLDIPFGKCTESMLKEAEFNVSNRIATVGLTEDFDRSIIFMKRMFGWRQPYYVSQNRSHSRSQKPEISPKIIEHIKEQNQYDIALYEYARVLFYERIRNQGNGFEQEVKHFQTVNRIFGKPYCSLHRVIQKYFYKYP